MGLVTFIVSLALRWPVAFIYLEEVTEIVSMREIDYKMYII